MRRRGFVRGGGHGCWCRHSRHSGRSGHRRHGRYRGRLGLVRHDGPCSARWSAVNRDVAGRCLANSHGAVNRDADDRAIVICCIARRCIVRHNGFPRRPNGSPAEFIGVWTTHRTRGTRGMRCLRRLVPLLDRLILRIQTSARFLLLRLLHLRGVRRMTLLAFAGLKLCRRRGGTLVVGFRQIQNDVKASSSVVGHERRGSGRRDNARPALPRRRSHGGCTSGRGACRSRSSA